MEQYPLPWPQKTKESPVVEDQPLLLAAVDKNVLKLVIRFLPYNSLIKLSVTCRTFRTWVMEYLCTWKEKRLFTHVYMRSFGSFEGSALVEVPSCLISFHAVPTSSTTETKEYYTDHFTKVQIKFSWESSVIMKRWDPRTESKGYTFYYHEEPSQTKKCITFNSPQEYIVKKTDLLPSWTECAKTGNVDGVLEHIRRGVDVNQFDENSYAALHWAARNAAFHIIPILLQRGANINAQTNDGATPLMLAVVKSKSIRTVSAVLAGKPDLIITNSQKKTAIEWAKQLRVDDDITNLILPTATKSGKLIKAAKSSTSKMETISATMSCFPKHSGTIRTAHISGKTAVVSLSTTTQPLRMIDLDARDVSGVLPLPLDCGSFSGEQMLSNGLWVHNDEAMAIYSNGIAMWNLKDQSLIGTLPAKAVNCLLFDERIVVAGGYASKIGYSGGLQVWNRQTNQLYAVDNTKTVECLALTSTRLGASQGGPYSESIWVWDIETCKTITEILRKPIVAKSPLWGAYGGKPIYFLDDNHLVAGGAGMCVYDVRSGEEQMLRDTKDFSQYIMCANDKYIACQSAQDQIAIWDSRTRKVMNRLSIPSQHLAGLYISGQRLIAVQHQDKGPELLSWIL